VSLNFGCVGLFSSIFGKVNCVILLEVGIGTSLRRSLSMLRWHWMRPFSSMVSVNFSFLWYIGGVYLRLQRLMDNYISSLSSFSM